MNLHLSRITLRKDAPMRALAPVLVPEDRDGRIGLAHRLLWTVFGDSPDRRRDFLWREDAPGRFLVLSERQPEDPHGMFGIETKTFAPVLRAGDRLAFALRANAVVSSHRPDDGRVLRSDVVMRKLYAIPAGERSAHRDRICQEAGSEWLARQGELHGFVPDNDVAVESYTQVRVPRDRRARDVQFSTIDLVGHLTVAEPGKFLPAIAAGFGRSRAFGCGLMLVRKG